MSSSMSQYVTFLEKDVGSATALVQKLTSRKEELQASLPVGTDPLPRSDLAFANGLLFTFHRKIGAGVSIDTGHGFIIAKLPAPPDSPIPWQWSAPLFIDVSSIGIGLTLGYSEFETITVLDDSEAVQSFTKSMIELDSDIGAAAGSKAGVKLPSTAVNLGKASMSGKTFSYSLSKGVMVDLSLTGLKYSVDERRCHAHYGPSISPADIIAGPAAGAPPPPDMMTELYRVLDHILIEFYKDMQALDDAKQQQQQNAE